MCKRAMKHILGIICIFVIMGLAAGCGEGSVKTGAVPAAGGTTTPTAGPDTGKPENVSGPTQAATN